MSRAWTLRDPPSADVWLGAMAVAVLGCGTAAALGGAAADRWTLAASGGLVAGAALVLLLAAGWLPGLVLLVLSLPLPAPFATDQSRVSPAAVVTAALLVGWLAARSMGDRRIRIGALPLGPAAALVAAVAVAAAFAQHPMSAVRELVNWLTILGLLVVASDLLIAAPSRVVPLARITGAVVGLAGAVAVLEGLGALPGRFPHEDTGLFRAALGFGQPNELAMFLALGLPLTVFLAGTATGPTSRVLAILAVACGVLGLLATLSRGSWLALLIAAAVPLLAGDRRFVLRVFTAALGVAVLVDVVSGGTISERVASTAGDWVVQQRAALTVVGLLMYRANPVVGVGPGGFAESLESFGPRVSWLWDYVGSSHNGYVQMAAETGTIGVVALLLFVAGVFRVLLRGARRAGSAVEPAEERGLRRALLWSFATACVVTMFEWPLAHGIAQIMMLVAAMGFALPPYGDLDPADDR